MSTHLPPDRVIHFSPYFHTHDVDKLKKNQIIKSNMFIQIDTKAVNSQHKMLKIKHHLHSAKVTAVRKIICGLKIRRTIHHFSKTPRIQAH